jgi:hypothetical protein
MVFVERKLNIHLTNMYNVPSFTTSFIFITWKNRRFCTEECPLQDQVLRGMVAMATDRNF